MFLTNLSLKRPVFITVTILAMVTLGILSYLTLNINDYPEVEFPYVAVTVVYPGASPEQVENQIAHKVEEALAQVSGVKYIYTYVREGMALVFAEFTLETKPEVAAQDVRDKIGVIRRDLPADIDEPVVARFDPMAEPIVSLAVTGNISLQEMTVLVDDVIKNRLEAVNSVGAIKIFGAEDREIHIELDKHKLAAYGLTPAEVVGSLRLENMEVPGGKLGRGESEIALRTSGSVEQYEAFGELPVARRDGVQLYVKDVGAVIDGIKEQASIARYQGQPAIGIDVIKQTGSNTVEVADDIIREVKKLQQELPPGVNLEIVRDGSVAIRDSVNDVFTTLFLGSLLAVITVFVFLRNWRSTAITAVAIPASIITTFFAMKLLGYTLNYMTLMALVLCIGLLIDDSIVIIENIVRNLRLGKTPFQAASDAASELGLAVTATTLTVVAVFFPVAMMTGVVGQFFKQFGITVVCAILISLFISFTLVPMLASRHMNAEEPRIAGPLGRFLAWFNRGFDQLAVTYARWLRVVLKNRLKTMALAVMLFVGSLMMLPLLGSSFLPTGDMGEVMVYAELDAGLSMAGAARVTGKMEEVIAKYPEVQRVYSTVETDQVNIFIKTMDKRERDRSIFEVASQLRRDLSSVPGVGVTVNVFEGAMSYGKDVNLKLLGDNLEIIEPYAEQIQRMMESMPGVVDVGNSHKLGNPEWTVRIKGDAAADLGISTAQVADTLRTMFNGVVVGQFEDEDHRVDVRVRLAEKQRESVSDLNNIYLLSTQNITAMGPVLVPLSQVTETVFMASPGEINRFNRANEIEVSANLEGISLGEFNKIFNERLTKEVDLPAGVRIHAAGDAEMMDDTFKTMVMAMITGVLFIFFVLAALFESYIYPFSIMLAIPMAVVGAIMGLLVLGSDLSLMSMIGMIMLMGLATKNGILLIDFTRQERERGAERDDALQSAAQIRMRPIIMTSMAMIMGMLPLALGLGPGGEVRSPMAHAIIGGLFTSTLLTLVVVPVIYSLLDDLKVRISGKKKQQAG